MTGAVFRRVLVANRGEIALRIIRTLRRLGVEAVAVYTEVDRGAPHVALADGAVPLGAARAYLDVDAVVQAAVGSGCDALHPGYGFLSENPALGRACAAAGVVFVGPPPEAVEIMGDKINAKRTVAASGVAVVPGRDEAGLDDEQLAAAALEVGLPVLLKPSAGGGGKGMRRVDRVEDLPGEIAAARREAQGAFGDATLLVERYVSRPRHIEMQVFADRHGHVVALGERECTLQRRHQKIVEEAPSPLLDPATRAAMADQAVVAARACGYVGAGTVEFIVSADRPDEAFFMEMNTRLQVEHPVTEMVLGVDLVELQLRVAAGEELPWSTTAQVPAPVGHAVEARIYAEDPARDFLPASGRVLGLHEATGAPGVRVDSALAVGVEVGTVYDPMLAKVVAHGPDRGTALGRLRGALGETAILGVTTNTGFLRRLLDDPDVRRGEMDTGLVERRLGDLAGSGAAGEQEAVDAAAAAWRAAQSGMAGSTSGSGAAGWGTAGWGAWAPSGSGRSGWGAWAPDGWRAGRPAVPARWRCRGSVYEAGPAEDAPAGFTAVAGDGAIWVARGGDTWRVEPAVPEIGRGVSRTASGRVTSPMPGTVLAVHVQPGSEVEAGERLVTVEAMKMEHVVTAPGPGRVAEVLVAPGAAVRLDQPLVVLEAHE